MNVCMSAGQAERWRPGSLVCAMTINTIAIAAIIILIETLCVYVLDHLFTATVGSLHSGLLCSAGGREMVNEESLPSLALAWQIEPKRGRQHPGHCALSAPLVTCEIYARKRLRKSGCLFELLQRGRSCLASSLGSELAGLTGVQAPKIKSLSVSALDSGLFVEHRRPDAVRAAQSWFRNYHLETRRVDSVLSEEQSDPQFMSRYFGEYDELLKRVSQTLDLLELYKPYRNAKSSTSRRIGKYVLTIPQKYWDLVSEEVKLETDSLAEAAESFRKDLLAIDSRGETSNSPDRRRLATEWFQPFVTRIQNEQMKVFTSRKNEPQSSFAYKQGPADMIFLSLQAEKMAAITINNLLGITRKIYTGAQQDARVSEFETIYKLPYSEKAFTIVNQIGQNIQFEMIAAHDIKDEQPNDGLVKRVEKTQKSLLSRIPSYLGVKRVNRFYMASLVHDGNEIHLGSSKVSENAARMVDCAQIILHGDQAPQRGLNFPLSDYYLARQSLANMSIDSFVAFMRGKRNYHGVRFFSPNIWRVFFRKVIKSDKMAYITSCSTDEEAARIYDKLAIVSMRDSNKQGEPKILKLNFPMEEYDLDQLSSISLDELIESFENIEDSVLGEESLSKLNISDFENSEENSNRRLPYDLISKYFSRIRVSNNRAYNSRIAMRKYLEDPRAWNSSDTIKLGAQLLSYALDTLTIECTASDYVNEIVSTLDSWNLCQIKDGFITSKAFPNLKFPVSYQSNNEKMSFPAFFHGLQNVKEGRSIRRLGVIWTHPALIARISRDREMIQVSQVRCKPMVVPPIDWSAPSTGGFLVLKSHVVKDKPGTGLQKLLTNSFGRRDQSKTPKPRGRFSYLNNMKGNMDTVYDALNAVGRVPWQINKRVLDVVKSLWDQGGGVAGLPTRKDLPKPTLISMKGRAWEELSKQEKVERTENARERKRIARINANMHSLRCDMELKLKVAEEFQSYPELFFPHNMDFRGRAYPLHPHLNHMGSDMCRGLLRFANSRPLGESGTRWLKIHLGNLYGGGVDKLSLEERKKWTEENIDHIKKSTHSPLTSMFWRDAESPFQFLGAAMELVDALESPNPELFESFIPVHQDGSCNGLQHYAALGRDAFGGSQVNLTPGTKPSDVYSGLAKIVKSLVKKDLESGNNQEIARLVYDQIDRKLVKQTVMTSVYGVTFIGARDQIKNRLKERGWKNEDTVLQNKAANYLAKVTFGALDEMFSNAKGVMNWLGDCAKVVGASGYPVAWTTPLGMPVVQPYYHLSMSSVKTALQAFSVAKTGESEPVHKQRQKTAFPPNYVHSLDSSHMMLTAIGCRERDIMFVGVHDSYWTHAGSVEEMNRVLREKFVEMHSRPLLQELYGTFTTLHPDLKFPPVPKLGDLDIQKVLQSTYFFA